MQYLHVEVNCLNQWFLTGGPWRSGRLWHFFQWATELGINQNDSIMRIV